MIETGKAHLVIRPEGAIDMVISQLRCASPKCQYKLTCIYMFKQRSSHAAVLPGVVPRA